MLAICKYEGMGTFSPLLANNVDLWIFGVENCVKLRFPRHDIFDFFFKNIGFFLTFSFQKFAPIIINFTFFSAHTVLGLLGADGQVLAYATQYIKIIALGTVLQLGGTGLIPFIRNFGSSNFAMIAMLGGFITNIILDFLLVWVFNQGMAGAALATIIGQGVTFVIASISVFFAERARAHRAGGAKTA